MSALNGVFLGERYEIIATLDSIMPILRQNVCYIIRQEIRVVPNLYIDLFIFR